MKFRTVLAIFSLSTLIFAQDCPVYVANENDVIIIDAEQRGPGGGWTFGEMLPGYGGSGYLVYKADSSIGWAEQKPNNMADERIKTYHFKVNTAGYYRVVLRSAAPDVTEHNDIFMSLPESGAYMKRLGVVRDLSWPVDPNTNWNEHVDGQAWFKVYQNDGGLMWNTGGKTVDFDGHDVITRELQPGIWYSIRICGRSTKFNVDRLTLYRCDPWSDRSCDNQSDAFNIAAYNVHLPQSRCEAGAEGAPGKPVQVESTPTPVAVVVF